VVDKALPWIDSSRRAVPRLDHLYDPHLPYAPPEPFKSRTRVILPRRERVHGCPGGSRVDSLRDRGLSNEPSVVVMATTARDSATMARTPTVLHLRE